jgi:hypothetical protein
LRSKDQGRKNMAEKKYTKAQRADRVFSQPEPPTDPVCPAGQKSVKELFAVGVVHLFIID